MYRIWTLNKTTSNKMINCKLVFFDELLQQDIAMVEEYKADFFGLSLLRLQCKFDIETLK